MKINLVIDRFSYEEDESFLAIGRFYSDGIL
jgi:hypothetical protein